MDFNSNNIKCSTLTATTIYSGATELTTTLNSVYVISGTSLSSGNVNVFKQKTGSDLEFRSLIGGININITENANTITINSSKAYLDVLIDDTFNTYSVTSDDYVVYCDTSNNQVELDLESSPAKRRDIIIKDTGNKASANNIIINGNGKDIESLGLGTSYNIQQDSGFVYLRFSFDLDRWFIMSRSY